MTVDTIIYLIVLIYSIILHEIAHGYVAYREGDSTAKRAGRITLNPKPHIDIVGSIIVPIISYIGSGATLGWAKGVPYNPHMLKHKYSEMRVAAAGVFTNLLLVLIATLLFTISKSLPSANGIVHYTQIVLVYTVVVNLALAIFNLLPLPPFDGLRIITSIFPTQTRGFTKMIDDNAIIYLMISIYIAYHIWGYISPQIRSLVDILLTL